jgi:hypothetical protein
LCRGEARIEADFGEVGHQALHQGRQVDPPGALLRCLLAHEGQHPLGHALHGADMAK